MPEVASGDDRAAKAGKISSHRWLGANTATPLFFGQERQAALTREFLESGHVDVDIFAVRNETTGTSRLALAGSGDDAIAFRHGDELTAEVLVSNRGVGHSFPTEVRDLFEAWLAFEVLDPRGRVISQSGHLNPDGRLDEGSHVYRALLLDKQGRVITRHEVWSITLEAYDNSIPAGGSDLVRYRFRIPEGAGAITLRARLNYRRFNRDYTEYVLRRRMKQLDIPIVRMAESAVRLVPRTPAAPPAAGQRDSKRWNDYGVALKAQGGLAESIEAFERARQLNPRDPVPLINRAVSELLSNDGPEGGHKAASFLRRVLQNDPGNDRASFYLALADRAAGRDDSTARALTTFASRYPRDVEVRRQLGLTWFRLGRLTEARSAFEALLGIERRDASAYRILADIHKAEGRLSDAENARWAYGQLAEEAGTLAVVNRFFREHPQLSDERKRHVHRAN
jgi:Flp pilus assembly protein TadD